MVKLNRSERQLLDSYYLNPEEAASFSSAGKLYAALREDGVEGKLTIAKIENYLRDKSSHYLYRPAQRRFNENKIIVATLNEIMGVDLMDVSNMSKENDGVKYVLLGVDLFSRRATSYPMLSKKCEETIGGFKKMFRQNHYKAVYADRGGEFTCTALKEYLKSVKTIIYHSENYVKVSTVERFIRTLRGKITRYLEANHTKRYIDALPKLIDSYNRTFHRSINTSPGNVNSKNSSEVYQFQYLPFKGKGSEVKPLRKFKFKIGDDVRLSMIKRSPFAKDSTREKWTEEIFTIVKRKRRQRAPAYKVEDQQGKSVSGWWWTNELQRAKLDPRKLYKLDPEFKIKERKTASGTLEYFVKFQGWPDAFNEWVPEKRLRDLQNISAKK